MNRKTILTGIAAFSATGILCLPTLAADYEWTGQGSLDNWNDIQNWEIIGTNTDGIPDDASDTALIQGATVAFDLASLTIGQVELANATLNISDASNARVMTLQSSGGESGELRIHSDGTLNVGNRGQLTLAASAATHEVGGQIVLQTAANVDPVLRVQASTTFGPYSGSYGSVRGQNDNAKMSIDNGQTLANRITVQGAMLIRATTGSAVFHNERMNAASANARVLANAAGATVTFESSVAYEDTKYVNGVTYRPQVKAELGGTVAFFGQMAPSLESDFSLSDECDDATLSFNAAEVESQGSLSGDGLLVFVNGGFLFIDSTLYDSDISFGCP